jgi:hypothetical protein
MPLDFDRFGTRRRFSFWQVLDGSDVRSCDFSREIPVAYTSHGSND